MEKENIDPPEDRPFQFSASFDGLSFSASGDKTSVFKAWNEFLENAVSHERPKTTTPVASNATDKQPEKRSAGVEPLSVFLERAGKTDSNPKIATAIVLWSRRHEQRQEIGPNDVKELWRKTKYKVPGNVPRELANAVKEGWLDRAGGGKYQITGHGEEFIGS
jgi:hypothetical protein